MNWVKFYEHLAWHVFGFKPVEKRIRWLTKQDYEGSPIQRFHDYFFDDVSLPYWHESFAFRIKLKKLKSRIFREFNMCKIFRIHPLRKFRNRYFRWLR